MVIKIGNAFFDIDKNVFNNMLEMQEIIVPYAWHSFCISINLEKSVIKLYHNEHIQLVQNFEVKHNDKEGLSKLLNRGHIGGARFVGILTDFQIFGRVLAADNIFQWTSCQIKVRFECIEVHRLPLLNFHRKLETCTHYSTQTLNH